ncbi:trigger factor [Oxalobacter vibrioformis]|uniref:Trigger factor n=1 Tax=Oxalobacter vibrioformis TaxID=933080 RepID=A0A9E9P321_9BURK|nr:trigger factor [Oxalobacter vibrioformis]WAW10542.1 trigger factor [Oxalobacter vibrioformis]
MANAVETLEKLERRVTITIPIDEVEKEVDQRLKRQAKNAKAPGFRPGKVPMNMVKAQYGQQIESDVVREKIFRAFDQVAREKDLSIAGYPRFEQKADDVPEGTMAFNATFEVYPDVKLGDMGQIELEKVTSEVTGEEVDRTIDILRKRQAHFHVKGEQTDHGDGGADTSAQDGDRVIVDFVGKIDGVEFEGGKADDFPFTLGEGQMLPEFEAAARGLKKGDSKTFDLHFPEDYHGDNVAGKTAEFTITVKNVEWAHLPDINEDFAKALGIADGSVEKMRAEIEKNLKMETKSRLAALNKKRVMDALLKAAEFDLPNALLQQEINQMMQAALKDLQDKGMPVKMDEPLPPELFSEQAERRVRLGLIFTDFIKDDKFKVSDDEVRARAEEIGSTYENPKMIVDYYMNESSRRQELEALVMEDKVVDYVFDHAKTVEKAMPFSELMAQQL